MPGLALFRGPIPPNPGELWCTACAMLWKAEGTAALGDAVSAIPDDQMQTFDLDRLPLTAGLAKRFPMQLAVAMGIFQPGAAPPMGQGFLPFPVPLCWSHLMGLSLKQGLLPASAAQMPQGVPLLGQRRG
jgi:hypothetical protein